MRAPGEKVDKYEQLLTKYDWHAARPPRGYVYGIGRGAKPFVTTAELSISTTATVSKLTAEENDFFAALERVERTSHAKKQQQGNQGDNGAVSGATNASSALLNGRPKLSLDDLANLESLEVVVGSSSTGVAAAAAAGLTVRSARTEVAEMAEEYLFSDERALTVSDVQRGMLSAREQDSLSVLEMGSLDEQKTWIDHSRVYRKMGKHKKAQQTLIDGCRHTGNLGPLIWEERLFYMSHENPEARRRLLEEAVAACPGAESLWLLLLPYYPPHLRSEWDQKAVIACPTSQQLWLRVLEYAPAKEDQRKLIRRAMQQTPQLPLLWARLARLEGSFESGKQIFRQAARAYPSLELVMEAIKYVEWHYMQETKGKNGVAALATAASASISEMRPQMLAAQRAYLQSADQQQSRQAWLARAEAIAREEKYVLTASLMLSQWLLPVDAAQPTSLPEGGDGCGGIGAPVVSSTWLEDVTQLLSSNWQSQYELLCALWGAWLVLFPGQPGSAVEAGVLDILRLAVANAPEHALQRAATMVSHTCSAITQGTRVCNTASLETTAPALKKMDEEEEEELARPAPSVLAEPPSSSTAAQVGAGEGKEEDGDVPDVLCVVLACAIADTAVLRRQREVALVLAEAFYACAAYSAALGILACVSGKDDSECAQAAAHDGSLAIATAKTYAKLGFLDEADACLLAAATASYTAGSSDDRTFAKLVIHRRSRGMSIEGILREGTERFPRSRRLWLMRLDAARAEAEQAIARAAAVTLEQQQQQQPQSHSQGSAGASASAAATAQAQSHTKIRELRLIYEQALSETHCRHLVDVWVFAAVRVESELLSSAATARALLVDASVALGSIGARGGGSTAAAGHHNQRHKRSLHQRGTASGGDAKDGHFSSDVQLHAVMVTIGLARARVELRHTGESSALEVVEECLASLPKTREGLFTVPVGELLGLFIDLSPPATRARAAAQVLKQWRSREPLALASVAKLYHLSCHYERALEEAIKAARGGEAASANAGRCGDAVALLLKLALMPEYKSVLVPRLGLSERQAEEALLLPVLPTEQVMAWVQGTVTRVETEAKGDEKKANLHEQSALAVRVSRMVTPNSGPLWIEVSKVMNPRNVTLTGFSDTVGEMLLKVADLIVIKK